MNNKKTVLICEDDEGVTDVTRIVLDSRGYNIETCNHSDTIVKMVKRIKPALILLDLWMPGVGGEHVCIDLKNDPETKNIPVIIVSATKDVKKIAENAGADDFIAKPFDISTLEDKVDTYIKRS